MKELRSCVYYKKEFEKLFHAIKGNFVYNGCTISKKEVIRKAKQLAGNFKAGDAISNSLKNSPEWWILTFACVFAGATVIVYPSEKKAEDIAIENMQYGVRKAFLTEEDVTNAICETEVADCELPYDGEIVLFTSGTQSTPKGVVIKMKNYIPNLYSTQGRLHMESEDINSGLSPYSHAMGLMYNSCDFFFGGDFIFCRNELEFTNLILSNKLTIACMQPIYLESMKRLNKFVKSVGAMRYVLIGGAPMSQSSYELYCQNGAKILNGYGMTECVAGIAITDAISNLKQDRSLDIMNSSIIKIADDGEILVSGDTVCQKYLSGEQIPDAEGWYHTRDIGYIDGGCLYVIGRKDNVIVCDNGYKLSLESIEERILKIDVIDACVVEYIDKALVISVVTEENLNIICQHIDSKLEYYEKPFRVNIVKKIEVQNGKKMRRH